MTTILAQLALAAILAVGLEGANLATGGEIYLSSLESQWSLAQSEGGFAPGPGPQGPPPGGAGGFGAPPGGSGGFGTPPTGSGQFGGPSGGSGQFGGPSQGLGQPGGTGGSQFGQPGQPGRVEPPFQGERPFLDGPQPPAGGFRSGSEESGQPGQSGQFGGSGQQGTSGSGPGGSQGPSSGPGRRVGPPTQGSQPFGGEQSGSGEPGRRVGSPQGESFFGSQGSSGQPGQRTGPSQTGSEQRGRSFFGEEEGFGGTEFEGEFGDESGFEFEEERQVDPREVSRILNEIKLINSQKSSVEKGLRSGGFSEALTELQELIQTINQVQAGLSSQDNDEKADAVETYRSERFFDTWNGLRELSRFPAELIRVEKQLKQLTRALTTRNVRNLSNFGLDIEGLKSRTSGWQSELTRAEAEARSGDVESALETVRDLGDVLREAGETILGARDIARQRVVRTNNQISSALREAMTAINAEDYDTARGLIDQLRRAVFSNRSRR